jgi:Leucine-rich repeat (LRR) protein
MKRVIVFLPAFFLIAAPLHSETVKAYSYKNLSSSVPSTLLEYWKKAGKPLELEFTDSDFRGWLSGALELIGTNLRAFAARNCSGLDEDAIGKLRGSETLLRFSVLSSDFPAEAMETVGSWKNLHHLDLDGVRLKAADFAAISKLSKLESLDVGMNPGFDGSALAALSGLRAIRILRVPETGLVDRDLECLAVYPSLDTLSVTKIVKDGAGWKAIGKLDNLGELDAGSCLVPPGAFSNLCGLSRLRKLDLSSCRFQGESVVKNLAALESLPALRELDLGNSDIGDEAVPILSMMANLEQLSVNGTRISPEGFSNLQNALSNVDVYY